MSIDSKQKIPLPKSLPIGYNFCRYIWHPDKTLSKFL